MGKFFLKRSILIVNFLFLVANNLFAQKDNSVPSVPSPQASDLLQTCEVNNNSYYGTLQISLPIINQPGLLPGTNLSLRYNGGGIRIDQTPGPFGLGWFGDVGGMITRSVKNQPDEYQPMTTITQTFEGFTFTTLTTGDDNSYLTTHNQLDRNDWSSFSFLQSLNTNSPFFASAPGVRWQNKSPLRDFEPDEFFFSIGSIQGKFAMNEKGNWIVKSDMPGLSMKVENVVIKKAVPFGAKEIPRAIVNFTLVTSDGTKYYFGESNNLLNNIEFSFSGVYLSQLSTDFSSNKALLSPTTWKLYKIVTPKGLEVNFKYKQIGFQPIKSKNFYYSSATNPGLYEYSVNKLLINGYFLDEIEYSNGIKIKYTTVSSNQLGTQETLNSDQIKFDDINSPLSSSDVSGFNSLPKVQDISLFYNNILAKKIKFYYIENLNTRLKLDKVVEVGKGTNEEILLYKLTYNDHAQLPGYASGLEDRWGFYNNRNYVIETPPPYTYSQLISQYADSRNPNFNLSSAESLKEVQFSTGGSMEFVYEPHKYVKIAKIFPFVLEDQNEEKMAGGLRLWKIIRKTNNPVNSIETTEYLYQNENGSANGILTTPLNNYLTGNAGGFNFRTSGVENYGYRGNGVVYPRVIEKKVNNGYIISEFVSFDNVGNDLPPLLEIPAAHDSYNNPYYSSNIDRRGLLRKRSYYNNSEVKFKEEEYSYTFDALNNNAKKIRNIGYLPAIRFADNIFRAVAYESDLSNILTTRSVSMEFENGKNITSIVSSQYDQHNNLRSVETINSKNQTLLTTYLYPYDFPNNVICQQMVSKYMLSYAIQEIESINGVQSKLSQIDYDNFNGRMLPRSQSIKYGQGPLEIQETVNSYDGFGNRTEVSNKANNKSLYFWGYGGQYLVAKVVGQKGLSAVVAESGIDMTKLLVPPSEERFRYNLNLLQNVEGVQATTYTYAPFAGVTSETDPTRRTLYYRYNSFGRLSSIWNHEGDLVKKICYNYSGTPVACDNLGTNPLEVNRTPEWTDLGLTCDDTGPEDSYTGYVVMLQFDSNPFSPTYNQYRYSPTGIYDLQMCPAPCNSVPECSTGNPQYRCIYGNCEEGIIVFTFSECPDGPQNGCECVYHYEWSDGSQSQDYYIITNNPCL